MLEQRPFVDEMTTAQIELTARIVSLAWVAEGIPEESGAYVREAGRSLAGLRRALKALRLDARDGRLGALLAFDSPLADYVRGLYAWSVGLVRALEDVALDARAGSVRWREHERRIDESAAFHLEELETTIRKQWAQMRRGGRERPEPAVVTPIGQHLDDLFFAAAHVARHVDQPRSQTFAPSRS